MGILKKIKGVFLKEKPKRTSHVVTSKDRWEAKKARGEIRSMDIEEDIAYEKSSSKYMVSAARKRGRERAKREWTIPKPEKEKKTKKSSSGLGNLFNDFYGFSAPKKHRKKRKKVKEKVVYVMVKPPKKKRRKKKKKPEPMFSLF